MLDKNTKVEVQNKNQGKHNDTNKPKDKINSNNKPQNNATQKWLEKSLKTN